MLRDFFNTVLSFPYFRPSGPAGVAGYDVRILPFRIEAALSVHPCIYCRYCRALQSGIIVKVVTVPSKTKRHPVVRRNIFEYEALVIISRVLVDITSVVLLYLVLHLQWNII